MLLGVCGRAMQVSNAPGFGSDQTSVCSGGRAADAPARDTPKTRANARKERENEHCAVGPGFRNMRGRSIREVPMALAQRPHPLTRLCSLFVAVKVDDGASFTDTPCPEVRASNPSATYPRNALRAYLSALGCWRLSWLRHSEASDTPTVRVDAGIRDLGVTQDMMQDPISVHRTVVRRTHRIMSADFAAADRSSSDPTATYSRAPRHIVSIVPTSSAATAGEASRSRSELSDGTAGLLQTQPNDSPPPTGGPRSRPIISIASLRLGRVPPVVSRRLPLGRSCVAQRSERRALP
jgi:hypothetical protein